MLAKQDVIWIFETVTFAISYRPKKQSKVEEIEIEIKIMLMKREPE